MGAVVDAEDVGGGADTGWLRLPKKAGSFGRGGVNQLTPVLNGVRDGAAERL